MYYLVKFHKDWADEFDVYGFAIFKESEWLKIKKELEANKEKTAGSVYFGTNEGWDNETVGDFLKAFDAKLISNTEKGVITRLLGDDYGMFPDIGAILNTEDEDDEDED